MKDSIFNNIFLSEDDSIVEPNVHDSLLLGVITLENKKLLLPIQTTDKSILCIACNDLTRLRVDDFREGNIILDITVSTGSEVEVSNIAYAHGLEQLMSPETNSYLDKAVKSFITDKKLFVQINPSYGCSLVCICGGIEILQNWTSIISQVG